MKMAEQEEEIKESVARGLEKPLEREQRELGELAPIREAVLLREPGAEGPLASAEGIARAREQQILPT